MTPDWSLAACAGYSHRPFIDPDAFFAASKQPTREAVAMCRNCPIVAECAEYAIRFEGWGFWGNLTEQQREEARRQQGIKHTALPKAIVNECDGSRAAAMRTAAQVNPSAPNVYRQKTTMGGTAHEGDERDETALQIRHQTRREVPRRPDRDRRGSDRHLLLPARMRTREPRTGRARQSGGIHVRLAAPDQHQHQPARNHHTHRWAS